MDQSFYAMGMARPKVSEFKIVIPEGLSMQKDKT